MRFTSLDAPSWQEPPPSLEEEPASHRKEIDEPVLEEVATRSASERYRRTGSDTPSWSKPRRYEAFPSLRPRGGRGLGAPFIGLLVLIAAAAALFLLPSFFVDDGGGGGGGVASSSPSARPSPAPSPSPEPSPTPVVYVVKKGDTLTKIAKANGVTLEALLAANKGTVNDPNKVKVGQELIIPVAQEEGSASPSEEESSPSPSP